MNGWISVKDALPENKKKVFCANQDGTAGCSTQVSHAVGSYFHTRWSVNLRQVTHWMEIPEIEPCAVVHKCKKHKRLDSEKG